MIALLLAIIATTPPAIGAACDGTTDDRAALQVWLDFGKDEVLDLRGYSSCYSSGPLLVDRPGVLIVADGPYVFAFGKTAGFYFKFAPGSMGFLFAPGATGSRLESLSVVGQQTDSGDAPGVKVQAAIEFRDVVVSGFNGHGVLAMCGDTDPKGRITNCNGTRLNGLTTEQNKGWGIWVSGGDSNAWRVDAYFANQNKLGCLYTKSFLGSDWSHVRCQEQDGRVAGGVKSDNPNSHNVFSWVYLENPTQMDLLEPAVRLGGFGAQTRGPFLEGSIFKGQWAFRNSKDPNRWVTAALGDSCGDRCAMGVEASAPGSTPLRLTSNPGWYDFELGYGGVRALRIADLGPYWGSVAITNPLVMGAPPNARTLFWSDGKPIGACQGGDFRTNSALSAANRCAAYACMDSEWVCAARVP